MASRQKARTLVINDTARRGAGAIGQPGRKVTTPQGPER